MNSSLLSVPFFWFLFIFQCDDFWFKWGYEMVICMDTFLIRTFKWRRTLCTRINILTKFIYLTDPIDLKKLKPKQDKMLFGCPSLDVVSNRFRTVSYPGRNSSRLKVKLRGFGQRKGKTSLKLRGGWVGVERDSPYREQI